MSPDKNTFVIIVGPTGVGKSALAMAAAEKIDGEIIACDSMQVYKGFDIGTDKPSQADRKKIPHHLIDVADGGTQFTAADFAAQAFNAILAIGRRGGAPLVVGGTGLYIKALLDGLFPGPGRDDKIREALDQEARERGLEQLWKRLESVDPVYAKKTGPNDRIRIIRALEVHAVTGIPLSMHFGKTQSRLLDYVAIKLGLQLEREELYRRIEARVDKMFKYGLVEEVRALLASGIKETAPPFKALGYKYVLSHLKNQIGFEEAIARTKTDTRHYAKRQMTWFRKMEGIRWFRADDVKEIISFVEDNLAAAG